MLTSYIRNILVLMLLMLFHGKVSAQYRIDLSSAECTTTLEDAILQVRELRRLGSPLVEKGAFIELGSRAYQLTKPLFLRPEDSGTRTSPTMIHGGVITGNVVLDRFKEVQIDGRNMWVCDAPKDGNRIIYTRQLWVNGKKALRAQQLPKGMMARMIDFDKEKRTITIPMPNRNFKFDPANSQMEMLVHQRWAIAILRVKDMQADGDKMVVTFHEPESQLEFAHPWPQPVIGEAKGNSSFCLVNDMAFMNEAGEWYQEYPSGKIYYIPRQGETINNVVAEIPHLETLVDMQGAEGRPIEHFTFDETTFTGASWYRPSLEGHVTLQGGFRMIDAYKLQTPGLFHNSNLENQAWIARPEAAVKARYADNITFSNCTFTRLGATALDLESNVSLSTIADCNFEDVGGTAIMVGYFGENGWETHIPYLGQNICDGIMISGNKIHDVTNEDWGAVGIACGYVRNTYIDGNEVSKVNYSGICLGWGWTALESGMRNNHITNNNVRDYARQLYDAGGIYTLSNQPGSSITGNTISAPFPAPYATNDRGFCIYFDEATDGFTVKDNKMPYESFGWNKPGPNMDVKY